MKLFFLFCFLASFLFADEQEVFDFSFSPYPTPWFTGPLLIPSAHVVKVGDVKFQPYLNTLVNVGRYNSHWRCERAANFYKEQLRLQTKFGILSLVDVQIIPIVKYQETRGSSFFGLADVPVELNLQLFRSTRRRGGPALKFSVRSFLPVGKYDHLSEEKQKTDGIGRGCWFPGVGLVFSDLWHVSGLHYVEIRFGSEYRWGVPVSIEGRSVYGGTGETRGSVIPGNYMNFDGAIEFNLTQRWALSCDLRYRHHDKGQFSGTSQVPISLPSKDSLSIAPAIEYNWSQRLGMTGGVWFSLMGRNYPKFINGVFSFVAHF